MILWAPTVLSDSIPLGLGLGLGLGTGCMHGMLHDVAVSMGLGRVLAGNNNPIYSKTEKNCFAL